MANELEQDQMKHYDVVVIGAGLSGVCAAIKLREAGITNIAIFEKASDVTFDTSDEYRALLAELDLSEFEISRAETTDHA